MKQIQAITNNVQSLLQGAGSNMSQEDNLKMIFSGARNVIFYTIRDKSPVSGICSRVIMDKLYR